VLVLTADPARRLADALGLGDLRNEPSTVALRDAQPGGELHAAMLETKASADAIIRRAADDEARAQRVLDNAIYQAFSNTLARSHAYAAMERVYEAIHDASYDLVIVDTPPAESALEVLDAPARLVRFLDQRVVRWFLQPLGDHAEVRGGALTKRLLATIAGESLVSALTGFLKEMAFLREGFADRARTLRDLMRTAETDFVLVTAADPVAVRAARSVTDEVRRRELELGQVVFNRAFAPELEKVADLAEPAAPSLERFRERLLLIQQWLVGEEARRGDAVRDYCEATESDCWLLPESTRALGSTEALLGWIAQARRFRGAP